jgi:hypothetical protein
MPTIAERLMIIQGRRRRESLFPETIEKGQGEIPKDDTEEIEHLNDALMKI